MTHALRGGFVVAQSVHYGMEWDEEEQTSSMPLLRLRTYLIDAETGNGGLVGEDLPWIAWIGDSSFITIRSLPYPKLEVRALASHQLVQDHALDTQFVQLNAEHEPMGHVEQAEVARLPQVRPYSGRARGPAGRVPPIC